MERSWVVKRVIEIISDQLEVEQTGITELMVIADLGADSLDFAELTMKIEEKFDIAIPDEVAATLKTVGQVIDCVFKLVSQLP